MTRATAPIVAAALAAVLGIAGTAEAQTPPKPDKIVVNASGGAMGAMMRRTYIAEFEKRHGIQVVETSPVDFGKHRAMVESGNVQWTVTELGGQDWVRAKEMNLLEPLDPKVLTVMDKLPEGSRDTHAFPTSVYSTVMAYRTDVFKDGSHPKNWAEFWDAKKFPGARSLRNHPVDNLEFALLADGVDPKKLYPIDFDRAFKSLDRIKPHVSVWWTTGAQPAQLLLDKEVVLASGWNGRFFDLTKKDAPVAIEWTGGSLKSNRFGIPRGAKDAYWGMKFLEVMFDPKLQAEYANALAYPGANPETIKYVEPKVVPQLPTAPDNVSKQFWLSVEWWTKHGQEAQERWNRWLLAR